MDDDPVLEIVMPRPETYPVAEEQRLLYVALTRTRNIAYTISNARMRSKFMKDLAAPGRKQESCSGFTSKQITERRRNRIGAPTV